jgi:serine/threonine protein phosphatase PrpC
VLIRAVGLSSRGSRQENEDYYCIGHRVGQGLLYSMECDSDSQAFRDYGLLAAVADGIGGYSGGAYASKSALVALQHQFYGERRSGCSQEELVECVRRYLAATQAQLLKALAEKPEFRQAGTTVAGVVLMPPDALVVFHAGDSRVLRASGGFIRALTVDHTVLGQDIASGRVSEREASRNPELLGLTRALGAGGRYEIELGAEKSWAPGDRFFICTDGFHGVGRGLSAGTIRESLALEQESAQLVKKLVAQSIAIDGRDNSTLVVVDTAYGGDHNG